MKKLFFICMSFLMLVSCGARRSDQTLVEPVVLGSGQVYFDTVYQKYCLDIEAGSYIVDKIVVNRPNGLRMTVMPFEGMYVTAFVTKEWPNVQFVNGQLDQDKIKEFCDSKLSVWDIFVLVACTVMGMLFLAMTLMSMSSIFVKKDPNGTKKPRA